MPVWPIKMEPINGASESSYWNYKKFIIFRLLKRISLQLNLKKVTCLFQKYLISTLRSGQLVVDCLKLV